MYACRLIRVSQAWNNTVHSRILAVAPTGAITGRPVYLCLLDLLLLNALPTRQGRPVMGGKSHRLATCRLARTAIEHGGHYNTITCVDVFAIFHAQTLEKQGNYSVNINKDLSSLSEMVLIMIALHLVENVGSIATRPRQGVDCFLTLRYMGLQNGRGH
jgi:hypothetical protein